MHIKSTIALITLLTISAANAKLGDTLYISADVANLRAIASHQSNVLITLHKGHKLIEFERSGAWINVAPALTGGKTGWVHQALVSAHFTGGGTVAPYDAKYEKFKNNFTALNTSIKQKTGLLFFTQSTNLNDGIIQITATSTWLNALPAYQQSTLRTIYNLWQAADGSGLPIAVIVVDSYGNEYRRLNQ